MEKIVMQAFTFQMDIMVLFMEMDFILHKTAASLLLTTVVLQLMDIMEQIVIGGAYISQVVILLSYIIMHFS
jgi:hypothetical protein